MFYNELMKTLLLILIILIVIYALLLHPNTKRKERMKPYERKYIAHRGLFNNADVPENSLSAFRKAVENGYGIELDVQLTTDDQLVVFHDASLKRMTGIDKNLTDCSFEELQNYPLLDTDEKIPLFADVLKVLKKDTPLIIEIKAEGRYIETTKRTVEMMRSYDGLYNMESFNPMVVRYLRMNEPDIIRGQLSYNYVADADSGLSLPVKFVLTNLLLNFWNDPDYIAYDCTNTGNLSFRILSRIMKAECVAWTVKSEEELKKIAPYYRCFIFDSFIPKGSNPTELKENL